jgi:hypothetical protein
MAFFSMKNVVTVMLKLKGNECFTSEIGFTQLGGFTVKKGFTELKVSIIDLSYFARNGGLLVL